jgi:hypothetical protein
MEMSQRLHELIELSSYNETIYANGIDESFPVLDKELFAKLIIEECVNIARDVSALFPRKDVGFDVGYSTGAQRVSSEIQKRFEIKINERTN